MKNIKKIFMAFTCLLTVTASSVFSGCDFEALLGGILPSESSTKAEQSSKDENKNSSSTEKPDDGGNTDGEDGKPDDGNQGENTKPDDGDGMGENTKPDDGGNTGGGDTPVNPDAPVVPDGSYTLEYTDNGEGYTVTGKGTFAGGALEIPATYNGKPVTMIGESAFYGCINLYSLTLPSGITSIAMGAFTGCINLTSVKLGEGLIDQCSLDPGAFSDCYKIVEIYEPTGMLCAGDETTFGGIATNALNVYSMFMGSSGLSTDANGFVIYEAQPDPMMPVSTSDEKVLVNYIGTETNVMLPNVTTVGAYAFYGNSTVQTVSMPDTVKILKENAFLGNALKKVFISASVTALASAFGGSVAEVEVDASNTLYSSVDGNLYSKDGKTLWRYMPGRAATEWTVPSTVEKIGVGAISGAKNLNSVTINENVKEIGGVSFKNCPSLETVTIKGAGTTIGLGAFESLRALKTVTITGSVEIGRMAFGYCSALTNLTLGEGVTFAADNSGYSRAFQNCTSLKEVRVPGSVERVYTETFSGCSLELLVLEEGVKYVNKDAFDYTAKIKTVVLPASIVSLGFSYNNKIETIYYKGTLEQRSQINAVGVSDIVPLGDTWYFYSETTPMDTENKYWYYDSDGNIALY